MARKRRAVERASVRQTIADRIIAGLLVLLAASGLMSILPGQSQVAVSRAACRIGSLGLGACQTQTLDLGTEQLNPPRCSVLATLDRTVPEVRVKRITTANGLPVEVDSTRSGDTFVRVGTPDASLPPLSLAGEARGVRDLIPGAEVANQAEWYLPGGQGADAIVEAIDDQHREWVQGRSSLALLSALLDRGGRDIPEPVNLLSRVQLDEPVLPHEEATAPAPPRQGRLSLGEQRRAGRSWVAVDPTQPALLQFNRISRESSVIAAVEGRFQKSEITGSVRWTRDATGDVTSVVLALVSAGPLAAHEPVNSRTSTGIAYLTVPVSTAAERNLAAAWLSDRAGFTLNLTELLGLQGPKPSDQLTSFLTRAATVTILRFEGLTTSAATDRVRTELTALRRVERPESKLLLASLIDPQPNGTDRVLTTVPSCSTP